MSELLNLLRDFFFSLFTGNFELARKRRELKKVHRELRQKNPDYFRLHTNEVLPAFAEALHRFSQYARSLSDLFEKTILNENSRLAELFKDHLVEAKLEEGDRLKKADFTYAAMKTRLENTASFKDAVKEIAWELDAYLTLFTQPDFAGFDKEFTQLERLAQLSRFPYEKLLSFFDPGTASFDKKYKPQFVPVLAQHLTQDLMDLYFSLAESCAGPKVAEHVMRLYRRLIKIPNEEGAEKIKKVVAYLDLLQKNNLSPPTLLCLIRLASEDPKLTLPADQESFAYLELYKSKIHSRFELDREKLLREHSEASVAADLKKLLGNAPLLEVSGYTENLSQELAQEGFLHFTSVRPFQTVKSFIVKCFEKSIKEHINQLVIDAFFENKAFKDKFINLFHETQAALDKITLFENSLMEPGEVSSLAVREYLEKHRQEKTVAASLNQLVETINDNAAAAIESIVNAFAGFNFLLEQIIADAKQHAPAIIGNIRVIGGERNAELLGFLSNDREKISHFVDIMKNFTIIKKSFPPSETARPRAALAKRKT